MAVEGKVALTFAKKWCEALDKKRGFRDFAVTDFPAFGHLSQRHATPADFQRVYALYLQWLSLSGANAQKFAADKAGMAYDKGVAKEFWYTENGGEKSKWSWVKGMPPLLCAKDTPKAKSATIRGYGQCDRFAGWAYEDLKSHTAKTDPLIEKAAYSNHNFVLVNGDAPDSDDWVLVDYWFYALGAKFDKSICLYPNWVAKGWETGVEINFSFEPATKKETKHPPKSKSRTF
jgi:hypothetical protein